MYCIQTSKDSLTILVFCTKHGELPVWSPINGGMKCSWGMKNCNFLPMSRFILETIERRSIVTVECLKISDLLNMPFSVILSDP